MKKTQAQRIIEYMQKFGGITSLEAIRDLGVMRLASRICDLKKEGYEIIDTMITAKNRYGENVSFKRYMLKQDNIDITNESHIPVI